MSEIKCKLCLPIFNVHFCYIWVKKTLIVRITSNKIASILCTRKPSKSNSLVVFMNRIFCISRKDRLSYLDNWMARHVYPNDLIGLSGVLFTKLHARPTVTDKRLNGFIQPHPEYSYKE